MNEIQSRSQGHGNRSARREWQAGVGIRPTPLQTPPIPLPEHVRKNPGRNGGDRRTYSSGPVIKAPISGLSRSIRSGCQFRCTSNWPTRLSASAKRAANESYCGSTASQRRRNYRCRCHSPPADGFLAENAHLPTCAELNIRFIGPSSRAMNALEDKA